MTAPTNEIPCPTCSGTGTDIHEDRHTETRMDTCRTCGGKRFIPARTGETPEASFQPTPSPDKAGDREGVDALRNAFRHVDGEDWTYLLGNLGSGGRARFWSAVFMEARAALSTGTEDPSPVGGEPHEGWVFHNPDTGHEWSDNHPVESGECEDATDIKAATAPVLKDMLFQAWDDAEELRGENAEAGSEISRLRLALRNIARLRHSEAGEPFDDALDIADKALAVPAPPVSPEPDSRAGVALEAAADALGRACTALRRESNCEDAEKAYLAAKAARSALAALQSAPTASEAAAPVLERVRHLKRGTEYEVLGEAEAQVSGFTSPDGVGNGVLPKSRILREGRAGYESDKLTVYRCTKTGKLWCRFTDEFRDGRFETITPTPAPLHVPAQGDR